MNRYTASLLLAVLLSMVSGLQSSAQGQSTYIEEMKILRNQYDVTFVYDSSLPLTGASRSVGNHSTLRRSLRDLFKGSGISYEIRGNTVILHREELPLPDTGETPSWVVDTLKPAHIEAAWQDTLAAASVSADRLRRIMRTQTGLEHLDASDLNSGFALFSTPDIIKTLQLLPGVAAGTELMSGLFVHGGTGGDNLFLLDGTPVYNTSHLIGLFSAFNSDIVESVDFYKSGFPARYGGRLSSVVDITTRDGDMYNMHGSFSLGLIDGRLQLEGPLSKGRTSFQFGLRRTWMETVSIPALLYVNSRNKGREKVRGAYAFWDLNFGITHLLDNGDILRLRFFNGMDRLSLGDLQTKKIFITEENSPDTKEYTGQNDLGGVLNWGSTTASMTWSHKFSDRLVSRTGIYYSFNLTKVKYGGRLWSYEKDYGDIFECAEESDLSGVHGIRLGADFDWDLSARHHFRFGASFEQHLYHPERSLRQWEEIGSRSEEINAKQTDILYSGGEPSVYIEDEMTLLPGLTVNAGLRAALFLSGGKAYALPEPRAALRFDLSDAVALKASYTIMNQFEHRLQTTYVDLPAYLWLPTTATIRPMHSQQAAAGVYTRLPHGMHLDIEGFWRTMDHIYEYSGPAALYPPVDQWESAYTAGQGRAYGAEIAFGRKGERTDIDVAYTLSWSERFFSEFSDHWYRDRNDNRHKFNITMTHKFSNRFEMYWGWVYHSGNRMTVSGQGAHSGTDVVEGHAWHTFRRVYSGPYNIKLPDYHRLDIGMNWTKHRTDGKVRTWNLSIYNAYCHMNPVFADIESEWNGYTARSYGLIPIIPTFSYNLKF